MTRKKKREGKRERKTTHHCRWKMEEKKCEESRTGCRLRCHGSGKTKLFFRPNPGATSASPNRDDVCNYEGKRLKKLTRETKLKMKRERKERIKNKKMTKKPRNGKGKKNMNTTGKK